MDNRPIGILDSGLGGLTVLKKVIEKLPGESTVFIGDQANMPYGDRTQDDIIRLTRASVDFLLSKDVKIIIFGCNTATAMAMSTIQKEITMQIIGVIQSGALAAAKTTQTNKVAVISTTATAKSHSYRDEIKYRNSDIRVSEVGEPKLAPLAERDASKKEKTQVVSESLAPLKNIDYDTLVLGCTHYPILQNEIKEFIGPEKMIVDPAEQVAQYTYNVLKRDKLFANQEPKNNLYYTTGDSKKFEIVARKIMNDSNLTARHIN